MTLDYHDATKFGGLPVTHDFVTCDEYLYACGILAPRHPVPTVMQGAYVIACAYESTSLVLWFADGQVIAV